MLERVKLFAIEAHERVNHTYGTHTYKHHLEMVVDVAMIFILLIDEKDRENVLCACWLHDTIEDCRLTYNDILKISNKEVADLVYALSNEKGKTRKERANDKYYNGIVAVKYARLIKLCDRIANVTNSINEKSRMFSVYDKENIDFVDSLFPVGISAELCEYVALNMLNGLVIDGKRKPQIRIRLNFWSVLLSPLWIFAPTKTRKSWEEFKGGLIKHEHSFDYTKLKTDDGDYYKCEHFGCNTISVQHEDGSWCKTN